MDKFSQLEKIAEMYKNGILTDEEFTSEKTKILANHTNMENDWERQEPKETRNHTNNNFPKKAIEKVSHLVEEKDFWSWATFFSYEGRMRRSHWWGALIIYHIALFFLAAFLISGFGKHSTSGIIFILTWWIFFSITIKRMHDLGYS